MPLICITNDMPDIRSCTRHDEHLANCDTWEYVWNVETKRYEATGKPCNGCVPREAQHGLLCSACNSRLTEAQAGIEAWLEAMRGVDKAMQRDNGGVRTKSGPPIPISPVQLAVDEVLSWYDPYADDALLATRKGAKRAVMFARVANAAMRSHPHEEKPHRIKRIRCTACGQQSLVWTPPNQKGARVSVQCQNVDCRCVLTQEEFEGEEQTPRNRKQDAA